MKKVLFGTTALVLSAGVAFADAHAGVSVSGGADLWIADDGTDTTLNHGINVDFSASGETDGGLGFGFDYTFLEDGSTDNSEVYISGAFGKLTVGDTDDALQKVAGIGDIGFDGLGVDNVAEFGRGIGDSDGALYENSFGPVTLYVSHDPNLSGGDDYAVGLKFTAGDITVGIGHEDTTAGGLIDGVMAVDLSGSFGGVGFDFVYIDHDLGEHFGTILSYDTGMVTVSLGYAEGDTPLATSGLPGDDAVGIGFSYDLGGGASLAGGVADNGADTVWDLGVSMSF